MKSAFRLCLAAIGMWLVLAAPARAQLSLSTSGYSSAPTEAGEAETMRFMRRLGSCIAERKHDLGVAFLASEIGSPAEDAVVAELFKGNRNICMGNMVSASMRRAYIRGSVAEWLYKSFADDRRLNAVVAGAREPEVVVTMHDFADCFVAREPAMADGLVSQTLLGTEGETDYVREMAQSFGSCLPSGREVRIVPIQIRMAIAEALYHAANGDLVQTPKETQ
ncbi:hypothetical protein [Croceicoccus marinus]|uniref:Uncharacterized protein n=1 Tax=Croceicoccus marinus TaxID=450378 RepID=A0A7G6VRL8_9SPHN|nr:hypothetical protein [Croceicoccus marinus]QNE04383.1 hypothetical protein H4O24_10355 [Croceicoccus marinus]